MEPKKEELKKKTTTASKKKTASTSAKKTTSSKKNTTTKTSTTKTSTKKSSVPKANISSTKKSTSTAKKSPSKTTNASKSTTSTTMKKRSTPSKQTTSKTKKSTNGKTSPVKVVQKKVIKTSLDKEIETPLEEPIKLITSAEKEKRKKIEKKKIDFQTINTKIKKAGNQLLQILKNVWSKLVTFFKNLKSKEKETKVEHQLLQSLKQFSFKLGSFFQKLKPIKKEKELKVNEERPFKTQIEKPKKKKRKWVILIVILLLLILLMLIPFGKDLYLSGASNKNLEAPKFMKLKEECCSYTATFSSPRSVMALKKDMEKIIEEYKVLQCDNKTFYYNASENYTITDYSFKKGILFNQLSITYGVGNSCDIDTKFKKLEVLPDDFSIEDAKKDGNYVIDNGKVYNKEAYINFMDQINKNIDSTLRIVTTNENKDVLITDVTYKDGKYVVSYDGTRDKNAKNNKSIVAYKFEHLIVSNGKLYAYNGDELVTKKAKKYETYYLLDVE